MFVSEMNVLMQMKVESLIKRVAVPMERDKTGQELASMRPTSTLLLDGIITAERMQVDFLRLVQLVSTSMRQLNSILQELFGGFVGVVT